MNVLSTATNPSQPAEGIEQSEKVKPSPGSRSDDRKTDESSDWHAMAGGNKKL
jgi:hypothetical protein